MTEKASSEAALWLTALGRGVYCAVQRRNKSELGHCALRTGAPIFAVGWGSWRGGLAPPTRVRAWAAATEMLASRMVGEYRVGGRWGGAYALL